MTDQKKASLDAQPRTKRVFFIRFTDPRWETTRRVLMLSASAAQRRAERIRAAGGQAVVYAATIGTWAEIT